MIAQLTWIGIGPMSDERIRQLERRIEVIDGRLTEAIRQIDARFDAFFVEHLKPEEARELLKAIYRLGERIPDLERRIAALEQESADADRG